MRSKDRSMNAISSNDLLTTKVDPSDKAAILALFEGLALAASRAIMAMFDAGMVFETKADASPVTEADRAAERVILEELREALAGIAGVAAEEISAGVVPVLVIKAELLRSAAEKTNSKTTQRNPSTTRLSQHVPAVLFAGSLIARFEVFCIMVTGVVPSPVM
ncbi:hypothetical protein [Mesorhizobium sp. f-mel]